MSGPPSSLSCEFVEGRVHITSIPLCLALSILSPNTCFPLPCKRIKHPSPLPVNCSTLLRQK